MFNREKTNTFYKMILTMLLITFTLLVLPHKAGATTPPLHQQQLKAGQTNLLLNFENPETVYGSLDVFSKGVDAESCKILSVKSNASFVKCTPLGLMIQLTIKKNGKATLTVEYQLNGKNRSVRYALECLCESDVFRKVSVNGKKAKYDDFLDNYEAKATGTKAKIKVKLHSGWKVKKIKAFYANKRNVKMKKIKGTFKNGSNIPINKGKITAAMITAVHSKTGQTLTRNIYITRKAKKAK